MDVRLNTCRNRQIAALLRDSYGPDDLAGIHALLGRLGTLQLQPKANGLYSAAGVGSDSLSGYTHTWLRDTAMLTNSQLEAGRVDIARRTVDTLNEYFHRHRHRFVDIIRNPELRNDPMRRPHVRFDGDSLCEIDQKWSHAQNDALGYALWIAFRLANLGHYRLGPAQAATWAYFPKYFEAIEYWHDADSGHWEEAPKVESSSIGVVVGALEEMRRFLLADPAGRLVADAGDVDEDLLARLISSGRARLSEFLPHESPPAREADAALLFLIYPLAVISDHVADDILALVLYRLVGEHGIKRYLGDSYWCADYKTLLSERERTADFSQGIEARDRMLRPGEEAQWCIFDPVVSVIYGRRYLVGRRSEDLQLQVRYLNRALSQVTGDADHVYGQCPELYYIENSNVGAYVCNDHVPLAWTQANLAVALQYMQRSIALTPDSR